MTDNVFADNGQTGFFRHRLLIIFIFIFLSRGGTRPLNHSTMTVAARKRGVTVAASRVGG